MSAFTFFLGHLIGMWRSSHAYKLAVVFYAASLLVLQQYEMDAETGLMLGATELSSWVLSALVYGSGILLLVLGAVWHYACTLRALQAKAQVMLEQAAELSRLVLDENEKLRATGEKHREVLSLATMLIRGGGVPRQ